MIKISIGIYKNAKPKVKDVTLNQLNLFILPPPIDAVV
jgi:hypothetical protein